MKKEIIGMLSIVCALCLVLTLSLTGCGEKETVIGGDPATWGPSAETAEGTVQIPNPWQECDSLEDAGKIAGFSFTAPDQVEGFSEKYIAAIEDDVAQVIFSKDDDKAEITFRKGAGDQDISGDYNEYESVETRQIGEKYVTVKSTDGIIYTAVWTQDGYSYSIFARTGMTEEQMNAWIQALS